MRVKGFVKVDEQKLAQIIGLFPSVIAAYLSGYLPGKDVPTYEAMISFRNRLVYRYPEVEPSEVYGIVAQKLDDIRCWRNQLMQALQQVAGTQGGGITLWLRNSLNHSGGLKKKARTTRLNLASVSKDFNKVRCKDCATGVTIHDCRGEDFGH